jgi:hypothetical protein
MLSGDAARAKDEALRGLAIDDRSTYAALGHYVLAEVYSRGGDATRASAELLKGNALDKRGDKRGQLPH